MNELKDKVLKMAREISQKGEKSFANTLARNLGLLEGIFSQLPDTQENREYLERVLKTFFLLTKSENLII